MPLQLNTEVFCLSYFEAKAEYREQLVQALLALIEPTRQEIGCLQYELILDNNNPNFFIMVEKFVNHQALSAHEQQPYIVNFVEKHMPIYCQQVTWHVGREILGRV